MSTVHGYVLHSIALGFSLCGWIAKCRHSIRKESSGTSVNLEFNHKFISFAALCPANLSRCIAQLHFHYFR